MPKAQDPHPALRADLSQRERGKARSFMNRKRPNVSKHMTSRARRLRQQASFPERLLWGKLREQACGGLKFRRQYPIGPYIVDFGCVPAGVVIELDGRSHDEQAAYDVARQEYLQGLGWLVLRFSHDRLLQELDAVVTIIVSTCVERNEEPSPGPTGRPLPEGEE
jgi:very-short-patch-repair endonuclease